jgi:aspartyl aminopeptidase
LWRTWFDRDLVVAGKVIVKEGEKLVSKYWRSTRPLVHLPSLCIHLDRKDEFNPNKETNIKPIWSMAIVDQLFGEGVTPIADDVYNLDEKHASTLTNLIAKDLGIERGAIVNFELSLADAMPSALTGMHEEFVSSPRLDNLASSMASLDALVQHSRLKPEERDHSEIDMIMLFDHEEIGSTSAQGANSNMAQEITERIFDGSREDYFRAIHRSLMISADLAHACHPNYSEKHQSQHQPVLQGGIVLKTNANQRYMTDGVGTAILRTLCARVNVPLQDFMVRNDSLCGSTIGPMMAAKAGIKTIDIGAPSLAMHSIREIMGVVDLLYYQKLFAVFFDYYPELSETLLSE